MQLKLAKVLVYFLFEFTWLIISLLLYNLANFPELAIRKIVLGSIVSKVLVKGMVKNFCSDIPVKNQDVKIIDSFALSFTENMQVSMVKIPYKFIL